MLLGSRWISCSSWLPLSSPTTIGTEFCLFLETHVMEPVMFAHMDQRFGSFSRAAQLSEDDIPLYWFFGSMSSSLSLPRPSKFHPPTKLSRTYTRSSTTKKTKWTQRRTLMTCSFQIHVILLLRGLCPDMAPGCFSLLAHHILLFQLLPNMVSRVAERVILEMSEQWPRMYWNIGGKPVFGKTCRLDEFWSYTGGTQWLQNIQCISFWPKY